MALNGTLVKSTGVAALGGLLFGFDTAVISGTTRSLTEVYNLTPYLLGVTVFSAILGTIFGSMFAGIPGDIRRVATMGELLPEGASIGRFALNGVAVAGPGGALTFATVAQKEGEPNAIYCRCPPPAR